MKLRATRQRKGGESGSRKTVSRSGQGGNGKSAAAKSGASANELVEARKKISELEAIVKTCATERDAALARLSSQPAHNNGGGADSQKISRLTESLAERDKMIATLRHSLLQYSDESDEVLLQAKIAERDRKITALENLLSETMVKPG